MLIHSRNRTFLFFLLMTFVGTSFSYAKNVGVFGATYEISEKDALSEIQKRVKEVNWKEKLSQEKMLQSIATYRPKNLPHLEKAKSDRVFQADMTYSVPFDVTDEHGKVLYPKGYTFNPLDHMTFPYTLVVIDGENKKEVEWFLKSPYQKDPGIMLLLSGGSYQAVSKAAGRQAFYINPQIVDRLKLSATPSVVKQAGRMMEVHEIGSVSEKN